MYALYPFYFKLIIMIPNTVRYCISVYMQNEQLDINPALSILPCTFKLAYIPKQLGICQPKLYITIILPTEVLNLM